MCRSCEAVYEDFSLKEGTVLKENELRLVCELIKNSRRSDRELAKSLGVSQPTVSRIRTKLEKRGIIQYTGTPDLKELGFEIVAITFGNLNLDSNSDVNARIQRGKDFLRQQPNVLFFSTGRGLNSDRVAVTAHKNYSDYTKFVGDLKSDWADIISVTGSFLISLGSDSVLSSITFKHLAVCSDEKCPRQGKPDRLGNSSTSYK
jgi:DNA-binding Lrp family transcriptional regulator